jgi:hypothetical protein
MMTLGGSGRAAHAWFWCAWTFSAQLVTRLIRCSAPALVASVLAGCAGPSLSPDVAKGIHRVAIVSAIGETALMKNTPFFRWDMFEYAYPVGDLGIDDFVKAQLTTELAGRYEIVPVEYDAKSIESTGKLGEAVRKYVRGEPVDAYLVVGRADVAFASTATVATGLGVIRGPSGSGYYAHAIYGIAVVDGKTFKELAVDYGSNPGESIFHGNLRGRPNEEVTEASWHEGEGALPDAKKRLLKPVFERLISRSLPDLVRKLKLIPSA